jgi:hypothetical protein
MGDSRSGVVSMGGGPPVPLGGSGVGLVVGPSKDLINPLAYTEGCMAEVRRRRDSNLCVVSAAILDLNEARKVAAEWTLRSQAALVRAVEEKAKVRVQELALEELQIQGNVLMFEDVQLMQARSAMVEDTLIE